MLQERRRYKGRLLGKKDGVAVYGVLCENVKLPKPLHLGRLVGVREEVVGGGSLGFSGSGTGSGSGEGREGIGVYVVGDCCPKFCCPGVTRETVFVLHKNSGGVVYLRWDEGRGVWYGEELNGACVDGLLRWKFHCGGGACSDISGFLLEFSCLGDDPLDYIVCPCFVTDEFVFCGCCDTRVFYYTTSCGTVLIDGGVEFYQFQRKHLGRLLGVREVVGEVGSWSGSGSGETVTGLPVYGIDCCKLPECPVGSGSLEGSGSGSLEGSGSGSEVTCDFICCPNVNEGVVFYFTKTDMTVIQLHYLGRIGDGYCWQGEEPDGSCVGGKRYWRFCCSFKCGGACTFVMSFSCTGPDGLYVLCQCPPATEEDPGGCICICDPFFHLSMCGTVTM